MANELREDRTVYPTMIRLRDCLCAELAASGGPELCSCELMPGAGEGFIDIGDCDEGGTAWVRLLGVFRSSRLPEQDVTSPSEQTFLAAQLEVGVARFIHVVDEDGTAPDAVDQHMDVRLLLSDMAAMERAIVCCFGETEDREEIDFVLGGYLPLSGVGGVGGGIWQVYARVR